MHEPTAMQRFSFEWPSLFGQDVYILQDALQCTVFFAIAFQLCIASWSVREMNEIGGCCGADGGEVLGLSMGACGVSQVMVRIFPVMGAYCPNRLKDWSR